MSTWSNVAAITLGLLAGSSAGAPAQPAPGASGHWEGKIQMRGRDLPISVDLAQNPRGAWIGSLSIPGSSTIDVPLGALSVTGSAVRFTATLPGLATFVGTLAADAKSLSGTVTGPQSKAPFQLSRAGEPGVKVPPPSSALPKGLEGIWEGNLEAGGQKLRMVLTLTRAQNGTALATLRSVDQGNLEIPMTTVTVRGKELTLEARAVSGTYRGTLGAGREIAGEWAQGGAQFPLTFRPAKGEPRRP